MFQVNNILCYTGAVVSCLSVVNMKFDNPLASLLGNSITIAEPIDTSLIPFLKRKRLSFQKYGPFADSGLFQ